MRKVKIQPFQTPKGNRYQITDAQTGAIIENAQGYGFKTESNAIAYAEAHGWTVLNTLTNHIAPLF